MEIDFQESLSSPYELPSSLSVCTYTCMYNMCAFAHVCICVHVNMCVCVRECSSSLDFRHCNNISISLASASLALTNLICSNMIIKYFIHLHTCSLHFLQLVHVQKYTTCRHRKQVQIVVCTTAATNDQFGGKCTCQDDT